MGKPVGTVDVRLPRGGVIGSIFRPSIARLLQPLQVYPKSVAGGLGRRRCGHFVMCSMRRFMPPWTKSDLVRMVMATGICLIDSVQGIWGYDVDLFRGGRRFLRPYGQSAMAE